MASLSATLPRPRGKVGHTTVAAVGTAAVCVLTACVLRIAIAATADPRFLVPSGRRTGYPRWMRGPLDGLGGPVALHTFLVLMAAMVLAWLVLLVCASWMPIWSVAAGVVAATLVCALAPPLLSTDVFNYIAYAQMGTHGINPYLHGPIVLLGQPVYGYTGHLWKNVPSAYGPLFTLLSYAFAPLSVAGAFWAFKMLTALAALGTAAFVCAAALKLGRSPALALVLVALNPLVLVYAVGGAHNDLLMELPLAAAIYFVVAKRPAAAGAAAVTAVAIKASAGLALPFILLGARPRRRGLAGAAAAACVIGLPSLLVFGGSLSKMLDALSVQNRFHWIVVSVPGFVGHYAGLAPVDHTARRALAALSAACIVALIIHVRKGRGWIDAGAAATILLLATAAWVLPWYVVWALPFVALVRSRSLALAAAVLTVLLMSMQLDHFALTRSSHAPHARAHRVERGLVLR